MNTLVVTSEKGMFVVDIEDGSVIKQPEGLQSWEKIAKFDLDDYKEEFEPDELRDAEIPFNKIGYFRLLCGSYVDPKDGKALSLLHY